MLLLVMLPAALLQLVTEIILLPFAGVAYGLSGIVDILSDFFMF